MQYYNCRLPTITVVVTIIWHEIQILYQTGINLFQWNVLHLSFLYNCCLLSNIKPLPGR